MAAVLELILAVVLTPPIAVAVSACWVFVGCYIALGRGLTFRRDDFFAVVVIAWPLLLLWKFCGKFLFFVVISFPYHLALRIRERQFPSPPSRPNPSRSRESTTSSK